MFRHHALSAPLLHSYNEWRRHTTSKLESEPDAISSAPITLLLNNEKSLQLDVDKQRVLLEDGSYITYDRCLIATAGPCRAGPSMHACTQRACDCTYKWLRTEGPTTSLIPSTHDQISGPSPYVNVYIAAHHRPLKHNSTAFNRRA